MARLEFRDWVRTATNCDDVLNSVWSWDHTQQLKFTYKQVAPKLAEQIPCVLKTHDNVYKQNIFSYHKIILFSSKAEACAATHSARNLFLWHLGFFLLLKYNVCHL